MANWRSRNVEVAGILAALAVSLWAGCREATSVGKPSPPISKAAGGDSAQDLVDQLLDTYGRASSYADSGELHLTFMRGGTTESPPPVPLSVTLQRPNKLRVHAYYTSVVSDGRKLWAANQGIAGQVVSLPAPERLAFADLAQDRILLASLAGGLDLAPPQLALLLDKNPLEFGLANPGSPQLLADEKLADVACRRVQIPSDDGALVLWIDAREKVLRRLELPAKKIKQAIDREGELASLEAWIDFTGARLNKPVPDEAFRFQTPRGAALQTRFLEPPPEPPHPLLGERPGQFEFVDLAGNRLSAQDTAGKVVVLDMWATWCGWCFRGLPNLEQVYQKYKDRQDVIFLAVDRDDASVTNQELQEAFAKAKLTLPIVRDLENHGESLLKVAGLPTTVVLGKDGTVQHYDVGYKPDLVEQLTGRLEKLLAGEDLAQQERRRYEAQRGQYERLRAEVAVAGADQVEIPRAKIAPPAKPRTLHLAELWKADLKQPGNVTAIEGQDGPRLLVFDGNRAIVELDAAGHSVARHELDIPEQTAVNYLRTAVDGQGKRWFAAFASGQQQFHLFDQQWQKVCSYPPADSGAHAGIGDVQLADLDGSGKLAAYVGYWGQVGVQGVSLAGERLWSNRSLEFVLRIAPGGADAAGHRALLCANARGSLVPLDAAGAAGAEIAVADRQLHTVATADLDGQAPLEMAALTSTDDGSTTVLGVSPDGKELWRHPLPAGAHTQPIEIVSAGRLGVEPQGVWLLAGADGSVHLLAADGRLIDRFNTGQTLTGLAAAALGSDSVLLVSSTAGLTAWKVEPAK